MLQPLVRRTWALSGQTPVLDQWDRRDRVSVITALALSPQRRRVRMFFRLLDQNAKAEDFVWFLNDLRNDLGRKLHVVWDNLGAHRKLPARNRLPLGSVPSSTALRDGTEPRRTRVVYGEVGPIGERAAGGLGRDAQQCSKYPGHSV